MLVPVFEPYRGKHRRVVQCVLVGYAATFSGVQCVLVGYAATFSDIQFVLTGHVATLSDLICVLVSRLPIGVNRKVL